MEGNIIKINGKEAIFNYKILDSVFKRAIGLMFRSEVKEALLFVFDRPARVSLHMLFVFMPIDLIFLDENKEIVELKEGFRPFTFYTSEKKAKYLIEAKEGRIKKKKIIVGQKAEFGIFTV